MYCRVSLHLLLGHLLLGQFTPVCFPKRSKRNPSPVSKGKFGVNQIACDGEFNSLIEKVKDNLNIKMKYAPAQAREPRIEQNNRYIEE